MRINKSLVSGVVCGVIGCGVGIAYEKRSPSRVFAATPVNQQSLPVSVPSPNSSGDKLSAGGDSLPSWNRSQRVQQIMRHGFPSLDTIRTFDNYVLSYDRRNRTANWVFEHLSPELLSGNKSTPPSSPSPDRAVDRIHSNFFEDQSVHEYFRSRNEDYRGSGYDRGHLAAAGNHKLSQSVMDQTFILSNISPQVGRGFNRDVWNDLEQYVRYRARKSRNLWVCTGPLYLPRVDPADGKSYIRFQVIGKNQVSVPTHFFKALVVENMDGSVDLESYVMANSPLDPNIPLRAYQVPMDSIERAAGFLLFHEIPKNRFSRINGNNPVLDKFQGSLAEDRVKRIASRKG